METIQPISAVEGMDALRTQCPSFVCCPWEQMLMPIPSTVVTPWTKLLSWTVHHLTTMATADLLAGTQATARIPIRLTIQVPISDPIHLRARTHVRTRVPIHPRARTPAPIRVPICLAIQAPFRVVKYGKTGINMSQSRHHLIHLPSSFAAMENNNCQCWFVSAAKGIIKV